MLFLLQIVCDPKTGRVTRLLIVRSITRLTFLKHNIIDINIKCSSNRSKYLYHQSTATNSMQQCNLYYSVPYFSCILFESWYVPRFLSKSIVGVLTACEDILLLSKVAQIVCRSLSIYISFNSKTVCWFSSKTLIRCYIRRQFVTTRIKDNKSQRLNFPVNTRIRLASRFQNILIYSV